jgi:hypothetical protein
MNFDKALIYFLTNIYIGNINEYLRILIYNNILKT